jgi:hypothetical protein
MAESRRDRLFGCLAFISQRLLREPPQIRMIYCVGLDPNSAFLQRLDFRPLQHLKERRGSRLPAPSIGRANDSCGEKKMRRHVMCAQDR